MKEFHKKLSHTTLGALAVAPVASGAINFTNAGFTIGGVPGANQFDWDIDGVGGAETTIQANIFTSTNFINLRDGSAGFGWVVDAGNNLLALSSGASIGPGASFEQNIFSLASASSNLNGYLARAAGFTSGTPAFVGFRFDSEGTTVYGWAELTLTEIDTPPNSNIPVEFAISRFAYDDTGISITAGAIPEPAAAATGLGLLALGAAGLRRMRRR
ncbi:MAG: hypothetical protein AAGH40_14290 [Verrucomicrobiota bacterium]